MPARIETRSPSLVRQLGFVSASALVVSNMVGTGIFGTTGFMAGDLGSAGVILLVWVAGALFALAGAFSYAELGINYPSSGGEYVYLTRAFGPAWGFMTGWVSFFAGFSAPIAANALAFADYLSYFHPGLEQANPQHTLGAGVLSLRLGGAQLLGGALIALFTVLNCFGVAFIARIQNGLTATKLAVIVCFILLAFTAGSGSWAHFSMPAERTATTPLPVQFIVSLLWVMFSYSGWNAATYVAEEVRRPERTLPVALAAGTLLVTVLFLGLNVVYIYSTPLEQMKGVLAV
ncbi:MAG: amino acid permease, partial [Acidobacteria bacterium]|nr:amino acid permease [Acidobacteriota bacterium]